MWRGGRIVRRGLSGVLAVASGLVAAAGALEALVLGAALLRGNAKSDCEGSDLCETFSGGLGIAVGIVVAVVFAVLAVALWERATSESSPESHDVGE